MFKLVEDINLSKDIGTDISNLKYVNTNGSIINNGYKTTDGINYDETGVALGTWLSTQRKAYKGKSDISLEKISLLDKIGMKWFSKNTDAKSQNEEITEKNTLIKQKEILHRVWTCINSFPNNSVLTKEDINREIVKQLTINAK